MIKLLARLFVEDYEQIENPRVQSQYISLSGILGLVLNLILFAMKFIVGKLTYSISLTSDAFNNLSDSLTSIVALVGSIAARKPADDEHPQGHGRFEYVASLIVGIIIMLMGIQLFQESIIEIRNPSDIDFSFAFVAVLIISNLVKVYMYFYNEHLAKELNSPLNDGVARDSLADTIATTGILLAAIVSHFTSLRLDGIAGMIIAVMVFFTGFNFAKDTSSALLGQKASKEIENEIIDEILKGDYIKGYHDLYIHDYGRGNIIAHAHVEVPSDITVGEMSKVIENIEGNVKIKHGILLVLHMDPRYEISVLEGKKNTQVLHLIGKEDIAKDIDIAAETLKKGELVVVPTETVYGLAGDGLDPKAIDKIYLAKERPKKNPLTLHIGDKKWVDKLAVDIPEEAYRLMDKFWPGPLTVVLKKSSLVPDEVSMGSDTIALRMPDNRVFLDLANKLDRPLACPSANISGRPSPTNVIDVIEDLAGRVSLILDDGPTKLGLESTIVDMTGEPKILRPGYYSQDELKKVLPRIRFAQGENEVFNSVDSLGHYQTRAKIYLYPDDLKDQLERLKADANKFKEEGKLVGILASYEDYHKIDGDYILNYGHKTDKEEISRTLFSKLRDFDRLNVDVILIQGIDKKGLGKSIMYRLEKAAGGNIIR